MCYFDYNILLACMHVFSRSECVFQLGVADFQCVIIFSRAVTHLAGGWEFSLGETATVLWLSKSE